MSLLLQLPARIAIRCIQLMPLHMAGWLGRVGGAVAYVLDRRHRTVALRNLGEVFGHSMSRRQIRAVARENFRRIGEAFLCTIKMANMPLAEVRRYVEFCGAEKFLAHAADANGELKCVFALGHFGNFELFAWFAGLVPGIKCVTTYRGLNQPGLTELMQQLRTTTGCVFFERRTEGHRLREVLRTHRRVLVGLLSDQHAGRRGVSVPFLGRPASTTPAPAILALRYNCRLFTAVCYRIGPCRWRIECGDEIPIRVGGRPRPIQDILTDINRAFEAAVLRDPANWFWVHNRWKSPGRTKVTPAEQ